MLAHVGRPAKVTFGCGPIAVLESETRLVTKYATLQNPKAIHHQIPQGRRPTNVMLSDARDFRVGTGRCTVS